jgi:hypothetical protein
VASNGKDAGHGGYWGVNEPDIRKYSAKNSIPSKVPKGISNKD